MPGIGPARGDFAPRCKRDLQRWQLDAMPRMMLFGARLLCLIRLIAHALHLQVMAGLKAQ